MYKFYVFDSYKRRLGIVYEERDALRMVAHHEAGSTIRYGKSRATTLFTQGPGAKQDGDARRSYEDACTLIFIRYLVLTNDTQAMEENFPNADVNATIKDLRAWLKRPETKTKKRKK